MPSVKWWLRPFMEHPVVLPVPKLPLGDWLFVPNHGVSTQIEPRVDLLAMQVVGMDEVTVDTQVVEPEVEVGKGSV